MIGGFPAAQLGFRVIESVDAGADFPVVNGQ